MAKFSRFDPRNKKQGRHKAQSKGEITIKPLPNQMKLLTNVADGIHPMFGKFYERKINDNFIK